MNSAWVFNFEWDPSKARSNLKKHGVAFERAATIFHDPHALSLFDQEHSQTDDRWITMGRDRSGVLLVIHHTYAELAKGSTLIRIFSARRATKKETRQYERG